ncbi:MAG: hypothetical protein KAT34_15925 [Candidatus Aminicenantes bacterium]|nr:hypothetical protein [Candidatus Aminicenantes bacterium]
MNKKCVSLFTLIVFSVFTFSCITRRTMQIERFEEISPKKTQRLKVVRVVKTNGEVITFIKGKKNQGKIVNNSIIGGIWVKVKGGKVAVKDKIIFYKSYEKIKVVTIPFSEIKLVRYKRFSLVKTLSLAVVVGVIIKNVISLLRYWDDLD